MTITTRTVISLMALMPVAAAADGLAQAKQTIFGMDCAPCAYGIEKGLGALDGVGSVTVSLNDGYAEVLFSKDTATSLAEIREVIRNNGFSPREASIRVSGRLALTADGIAELQTDDSRYLLRSGDARMEEALKSRAGLQVELTGNVPADDAEELVVTAIGN